MEIRILARHIKLVLVVRMLDGADAVAERHVVCD
jgi:hypothetical protein